MILDVVKGDQSAADVCREIRAIPSLVAIPVLCVSQTDEVEERIRFLEAGADDVMAKPFDGRELEARVEALKLRFQRSKDRSAVVSTDGVVVVRTRRVVAVHSPKGGVGTSTVATKSFTATRADNGRWSVDVDGLGSGDYDVSASQVDAGGNTGVSAPVTRRPRSPGGRAPPADG